MLQQLWVDVYRPKNISEFICDDESLEKLSKFIEQKSLPNLIFHGGAGLGKTSCALMLAKEIDAKYIMINASIDNSIEVIREKVTTFCSGSSFGKPKVVILDECERLSPSALDSLKGVIEKFQVNNRFIFTTNYIEQLSSPIFSRIIKIEFGASKKGKILKLCKRILNDNEISFDDEQLSELIHDYYPDIRSTIHYLQYFSNLEKFVYTNKYDEEIETNIVEILIGKGSNSSKYLKIRSILVDSDFKNWDSIMDMVYTNIDQITEDKYCEISIKCAEYVGNCLKTPNKEINAMAFISEIITIVK